MRCLLLVGLLTCLAGCSANQSRPWLEFSGRGPGCAEQSRQAAAKLEKTFGGVVRDVQAEARIERLARHLAQRDPQLPQQYEARLLNTCKCNAASLPDGRLYITSGFYDQLGDDAHLAAVIAHELAHIAASDHTRGRCCDSEQALQRESAADVAGIAYLAHAGYPSGAMGEVIALIADEQPAGWIETRLSAAQQFATRTNTTAINNTVVINNTVAINSAVAVDQTSAVGVEPAMWQGLGGQ